MDDDGGMVCMLNGEELPIEDNKKMWNFSCNANKIKIGIRFINYIK